MEQIMEQFINDIRDRRLQQVRNRVASRLKALRQGRKFLKKQEQDKLYDVAHKLERVLDKFKELGYVMEEIDLFPREYFNFRGTHGISKIKGVCHIYIADGDTRIQPWYIGATQEPVIILEAYLCRDGDWHTPRVCRISYRKVMRTTNEILQVLLKSR